jgi:histidinol phosphatase-like PHP family hydrolase
MKIDTHIHTSNWSDGKNTVKEMIQAGIDRGLDGLIITDHDCLLEPHSRDELNKLFSPFKIFTGSEISVGMDHVLIIGCP